GNMRFTGQLVLLTSDRTASSAEDFVLSLAARKNVTIIGTATSGTFSDMYSFQLPNKMNVTLSNQRYYSQNGTQLLESKGIAADETIPYSKSSLTEKRDPQLTRAVELLR
ncbi:MAG: S41 family peptidase, partial [Bacteroidia bacterium]